MRNVVVMQPPGPGSAVPSPAADGHALHGPPRHVLLTLAVSAEGRRRADAPTLAEGALPPDWLAAPWPGTAFAVLDHAGPRASAWLVDRAVGPSTAPDVVTGRAPVALDEAGWARITADFVRAADACRAAGIPFALGAWDDGLLHTALSPRSGDPADGLERLLTIHRAVGGGDVVLVVEELCPRGLDATDGIAIARALVAQGAGRIFAAAGTDALSPLRRRVKGSSESDPRHAARSALASAAWLVDRVEAEIFAVIPRGAPGIEGDARALGLAGVIVEDDPVTLP